MNIRKTDVHRSMYFNVIKWFRGVENVLEVNGGPNHGRRKFAENF